MKRMFKCLNVLLLSACTGFASYGKTVDENTAKAIGCNQLISVNATGVSSPSDLTTAYVATAQGNFGIIVDYYVFNIKDGVGFVMVSGDDDIIPILAYSTESSFDINKISPAAKDWVEGYQNQITAALTNHIPAKEGTAEKWNNLKELKANKGAKTTAVAAMVKTTWDQDGQYRLLCPSGTPTGCVATAAVQVMRFWNWPSKGCGYHEYTHATYGKKFADFGNTVYDWASLPLPTCANVGTSSTAAAKTAIKTIMFHFGVAVDMNYGTSSSGAYTLILESPKVNCSEYALKTYFHYKRTIHGLQRYVPSVMGAAAWGAILQTELNAGRPILYSGHGASGGHAWVCDGWSSVTMFHFNWGWSGYGPDGYYSVDDLSPPTLGIGGGGGNFNTQQAVIMGIEPDSFAANSNAAIKLDAQVDIPAPMTSPSIYPVPAFSVATKIINTGTASFNGDFCAQIFDESWNYITTLNTLSNQTLAASASVTMSFASATTMYQLVPGFYRLRVMHRATGSTTWTAVGDNGVYINENDLAVGNSGSMTLGSALTLSSGTSCVKTGQPFTVTGNVKNNLTGNFNGSVRAVFTNVANGNQYVIQNYTGTTIFYSSSNTFGFTIPSVTVTPGTYTVAIQHQSGTSAWAYTGSDDFQNPVLVTVCTGVNINEPVLDAERVNVYPNPANDVININMNGVNASAITITDIQGRKIQDVAPAQTMTVPVNNYAAGIYFVNLYSGSEVVSKKIVIAK